MQFNSIEFFFFLPITFLLYWFVSKQLKWQNFFLVIASYVFYGWWDWRFLLLMTLTTFSGYAGGLLVARYEGQRTQQKRITATVIILNLVILGLFKYYNFFGENLAALFRSFGIRLDWITIDILLPVGISFYTFQALSYSIDVYQKKLPACRDAAAFFAYISFFPQLVAGPIERSTNLLPQFCKPRTFDYTQAVDGCRQMLWGFFKKVAVADTCAETVDIIWDNYTDQSGFTLLIGGILFTFQIYGDFSGYSDIAIGTARLFGINLMRNFNFPYFSRDIAEFWRRWHISLTTWFRDYIYIPLGGSRCARWKVMRNTLIIFLVSGFWHGANWTFIIWGAYHALLFFPLILLGMNRKHIGTVAAGHLLPNIREAIQMLTTFFLTVLGWIIFRAENIGKAWEYFNRMCSASLFNISYLHGKRALALILVLTIVEWLQRNKQHALQIDGFVQTPKLRWSIYLIVIIATFLLLPRSQAEFIYFQF